MPSKLNISSTLSLPLDFVTQTQAILAIKRVGKSYTASVQAEELLKALQQVVAIDITGAWWGLRSNAAGDGPGFPITIFGGDHGDLPLEAAAGETLAEALVSERFSAILDLSLLRKADILRFLVTFLETLYRKNRKAMHLFCDEADFYAPQKPFGTEIQTLGAMNDIVLRGGIKGIGCTLITQRPARINKDVLTQCGMLTCLRMSHPRDMEAIEEWVAVHGDEDLAEEMKQGLPALPKGTAWVWAAGWPTEEGIFKRIQIRQRFTFNSGATPTTGHVVAKPKVMAKVDLQKLGEKLAATVQQVKDNNPALLKAEIARLKGELAKGAKQIAAPAGPSKADTRAIDRAVAQATAPLTKQLAAMKSKFERVMGWSATKIMEVGESLQSSLQEFRNIEIPQVVAHVAESPVAARPPQRPMPVVPSDGSISASQQRILNALIDLDQAGLLKIGKPMLAGWCSFSPTSGGYHNNLGKLRSLGLIEYPGDGEVQLTSEGRSKAVASGMPMTTEELFTRAGTVLSGSQKQILAALRKRYPEAMAKSDIANEVGASPTSGGFHNNLGKLRSLGMIEYPAQGAAKAAEWLFIFD